MAGYVNSWIEQYTTQPTPCIQDTVQETTTLSNCVLWLIVGLVIGSLTFEKKREMP